MKETGQRVYDTSLYCLATSYESIIISEYGISQKAVIPRKVTQKFGKKNHSSLIFRNRKII